MNIIEAKTVISNNTNIAIIVSRFNKSINKNLLDGVTDTLIRIGNIKEECITIIWVPGVYEIPITANKLIHINKYKAIITLGTVIKGETDHHYYVANECASRLSEISVSNVIPIIFGILTTNNIEQAVKRSGIKLNNKGVEIAITTLEMINLMCKIR
ncbi:MAG: 6,7-dimethyl-8-ribityllumazine synthase [Candidatus Lightella neohaematopini]|nr:6,7-dimethyl-8-ribityllumazine synthase [Candidatus Lightella neohaematopini]MCV2531250.1 6,7-dimethyl-8-ribityllumazine synthase [Candidatus Lightella neohaematopini]